MKAINWKSRPFYEKLFVVGLCIATPFLGLVGVVLVWLIFWLANKWLGFVQAENTKSSL